MNDIQIQLRSFLGEFDVTPERGFLPKEDPLSELPAPFLPHLQLVLNLPDLLDNGNIRTEIESLPGISVSNLTEQAEQELLLLILSFLGHAYTGKEENYSSYIPATIAGPWVDLSECMGRLPIIQHSGMVLRNWKRMNPQADISLENLAALFSFTGTKDEEAFFMITVLVELAGAKAIKAACGALLAAESGDQDTALRMLQELPPAISGMKKELNRMFEHCKPEVFYHQIRPYLASFEDMHFQGVSNTPIRSYHGGSAAQSTLFPVLDAILGVKQASPYLTAMRAYMPPRHAALVKHLEARDSLMVYSKGDPELESVRQEAVEALVEIRNLHLKIVAIYILGPAAKSGKSSHGTGGTNPSIFLKEVRDATSQAKNP